MCARRTAANEEEPAVADWVRLDVLVDAGAATRCPELVASLRATGHRVRVATTEAHASADGGPDLPDLVVAEVEAAGAAGLGAVAGLVEQGIPVFSPDRVRSALEDGRAGDLLGPFDLDRIA